MGIMNSFVNDIFERIAGECSRLAHYNKRSTITSRENQTAVRLLPPGELAKHAVSEGTKAVTKQEVWKNWEIFSSIPLDTLTVVVKFWTGRAADEDVEQYLRRCCAILHPPEKPLDQFGIWYGVRRYRVKLHRGSDGRIATRPNSISMGPYNGKITYAGQVQRCYICNASEHQVKDCNFI
ncbi:hypothetical protein SKAU_G00248840 [Synaphobranchus kaupii]|uniref:Histone H2B n=1 Tax=Synaphobranchus kaupii TaxID=118154 RepID=A0A9Q1F2F2_SYNKA|nr:hypothetical protein SKAU_G00248840 [Synaphobranchus kaupii]